MTYYLYARPSFIEGMARVLDLGATLTDFNYSLTPEEADFAAIQSDWQTVGDDIRAALEQFAKDHAEEIAAAKP